MNLSDEISNNYIGINDQEYFDFNQIYRSLISEKKFILFFIIISFLLSIIFAATKKHIWEGQFQIVITNKAKDSNESTRSLQNLQSIFLDPSSLKNNDLGTQVGILESPSVLMPVFKFVRKEDFKYAIKILITPIFFTFIWLLKNVLISR